MDEKQILIRIKTEFKEAALNALRNGLSGLTNAARGATGGFANFVKGFSQIPRSVKTATQNLLGWNSIFGRVTLGMLTWQAWRTVVNGFHFITDAIVGANAAIQTAQASFTTLTGSSEKANKLIGIVRDVAMQTGVAFSDLVFESRRLTTQIGQNEVAFQKVTKAAVALSVLDPVQGISGAMFALSNFLEGTAQGARSLAQRFELPFGVLKQALQEAATPVEALDLAFRRLGIDVDDLIQRGRYTLPVIVSNLKETLRYFIQLGTQPFMTRLTQDLARLRDFIEQNKEAILGLAKAIGQMLERLYMYARALLQGIFPGLSKIFNMKLPEFKDKGKGVVKDFGEGLTEGMAEETSKAAEKAAAEAQQAAAEAVIEGLRASERAQKAAIRNLEAWVDEAAKAVQDKRDQMKLFDLMTEDIPERFTRGRRRQLELELLKLEQEERRRKEALDIAQRQLQATQDQIAAQRDLVSALKDTVKELEDAEDLTAGAGEDFGMGEIDLSESEAAIDAWAQTWSESLGEVETKIKNFITAVAQLARGLLGKEPIVEAGFPGQTIPFENIYELGKTIRAIGGDIKTAMDGAWESISSLLSGAGQAWNSLDPQLKTVILAILGGLMFPKLALAAGLILELNDPGNIKGILAILLGLVGTVPGAFTILINLVGVAKGALVPILGAISGLAGGGALGAAAIVLPLVLIAEIWFGRKELSKWISGEHIEELKTIISVVGWKQAAGELVEGVGTEITQLMGMDEQQVQGLGQWLADTAMKLGLTFGEEMSAATKDTLVNAEGDIEAATEQGVHNPIVKIFNNIYDAIVRRSIVPDMLRDVRLEFQRFPSTLVPALQALMRLLIESMTTIKLRWAQDWTAMYEIARLNMERITLIQNQALAAQAQLAAMSVQNTAVAPSVQLAGEDGNNEMNVALNLDQNETRRLMEEGTYRGILALMAS